MASSNEPRLPATHYAALLESAWKLYEDVGHEREGWEAAVHAAEEDGGPGDENAAAELLLANDALLEMRRRLATAIRKLVAAVRRDAEEGHHAATAEDGTHPVAVHVDPDPKHACGAIDNEKCGAIDCATCHPEGYWEPTGDPVAETETWGITRHIAGEASARIKVPKGSTRKQVVAAAMEATPPDWFAEWGFDEDDRKGHYITLTPPDGEDQVEVDSDGDLIWGDEDEDEEYDDDFEGPSRG